MATLDRNTLIKQAIGYMETATMATVYAIVSVLRREADERVPSAKPVKRRVSKPFLTFVPALDDSG